MLGQGHFFLKLLFFSYFCVYAYFNQPVFKTNLYSHVDYASKAI